MMPIRWMAPERNCRWQVLARPSPTYLVFCYGKSYLAAQRPYSDMGNRQVIELILAGKRLSAPDACAQLLRSVIHDCFHADIQNPPPNLHR